jgi:hypothetical protein
MYPFAASEPNGSEAIFVNDLAAKLLGEMRDGCVDGPKGTKA